MRPKSIKHVLLEAMKGCGGQGATANIAKQRLDMFGNVNLYCGMENYEKKLNLLRKNLQLAASITEVYKMDKADAQAKNNA